MLTCDYAEIMSVQFVYLYKKQKQKNDFFFPFSNACSQKLETIASFSVNLNITKT